MAKRFSFSQLTPAQRIAISKLGNRAQRAKGLTFQFKEDAHSKAAGRLGGLATWRKWKISRRGKELRIPDVHSI
jgi:hypothetical protein